MSNTNTNTNTGAVSANTVSFPTGEFTKKQLATLNGVNIVTATKRVSAGLAAKTIVKAGKVETGKRGKPAETFRLA